LRIIGGTHRSRVLNAPASLPVRPTTDFAKTGLFNILDNRFSIKSCSALDLYAGIGSFSFEFLSRGCGNVICVDKHAGCIKFINETKVLLKDNNVIKPIQTDVLLFLENNQSTFDIILADPPYAETPAETLVNLIFSKKMLKQKGVFILEHASSNSFSHLKNFESSRKYGSVTFSFFSNIEE